MLTRSISDRRTIGRTAAATLIAFALVATACGGDDDDTVAPATTPAPETGGDDDGADDGNDDGDGDGDGGDAATTTSPAPVVTVPPAPDVEVQYGGRIVVAIEAETISPWRPVTMTCDTSCHIRARTFFEPLVVVDDDLEARPFLLESLEANDDATVFTLTLREGIRFHDGSELDADVAMDNINRTFNGILVSGSVKDIARNEDGSIRMEKLDDYTFTLHTGFRGNPSEPISWPLFPYLLAGQAGLIASSEWLAAVDAGTATETDAVGTGPFILSDFQPNDRLTVVRNPDYWRSDEAGNQLPYLDEIEFRVIQDSQVRSQALRSGDVDLIATSDSFVVDQLSNDPSFGYVNQDQYSETNYFLLNLTKPYFTDRDVRCALTQAIDRVDYIDVVAGGAAVPSVSPFTPGQEGYLADLEGPPFDPGAAAAVIAAWEAENGPLTINISTTATVTNLTASQYLTAVWGDIGVDVTINPIGQTALILNALFGVEAFDVFAWRNHGGLYVDTQYYWWHGSSATPPPGLALNFGRLDDPVINELLEKSRTEFDPAVRRTYAEDINRRFVDQCFIIPTAQTRWGIHYDPKIQNIGRTPMPDLDGFMRDGAGFAGQLWFTAIFVAE